MKKLLFLVVLLLASSHIFITRAQCLQNVNWTTLSGINIFEDFITNSSTSSGYALSGNIADSYSTGYIEFSNFQIDQTKSIGLVVPGNTGAMDHFFSFVNNKVAIYNGSTLKVAAYTFSKGDKFMIAFNPGFMQFFHNGVLKVQYSFDQRAFQIKAILGTIGSRFSGIKTSIPQSYTVSTPTTMNYVQTIVPLQATTSVLKGGTRKTGTYLDNVAYIDGLGRPTQIVGVAQSPMLKDVVMPEVYDNNGLKTKEYLPYTVKTTSPGSNRSSPITEQASFYSDYYYYDKDYAYTDINYELSPLNRVKETVGTGTDWKGKLATDPKKKSVQYDYGTNTTAMMLINMDDGSPATFYLRYNYAIGSL